MAASRDSEKQSEVSGRDGAPKEKRTSPARSGGSTVTDKKDGKGQTEANKDTHIVSRDTKRVRRDEEQSKGAQDRAAPAAKGSSQGRQEDRSTAVNSSDSESTRHTKDARDGPVRPPEARDSRTPAQGAGTSKDKIRVTGTEVERRSAAGGDERGRGLADERVVVSTSARLDLRDSRQSTNSDADRDRQAGNRGGASYTGGGRDGSGSRSEREARGNEDGSRVGSRDGSRGAVSGSSSGGGVSSRDRSSRPPPGSGR